MNRLIAMSVAMIIAFSCFFSAVNAVETDTDDKDINKAVKVLSALSILTDYSERIFKADTLITHGECAAILTRILASNELAENITSEALSDVPSDWRAGYITMAVRLGIIGRDENGKYGIEEAETFNGAVKMIVNILGYGYFAENSGGYPMGYLMEAAKLKFADGIIESGEAPLTRGEFARMVYKALDVDICEQKVFGTSANREIIPGHTLLTEKLDVTKEEGKVYANYITSLVNPAVTSRDEETVVIEEENFNIGVTDAGKYLGYRVEYYYKENGGENTLLYVSPAKNVKEITVDADNIAKKVTNKNELVSLSDNSEKKYKISRNADVLYNGKANLLFTDSDLLPDTGSVKLIDNNNDNVYDTVMIESYKTYMAEAVSTITKRINFMFPNGTPTSAIAGLDTDDPNSILEVFSSTGIMQYTNIKKHDVLSVAQSKNTEGKKYIKVLVSQEQMDGEVLEIANDDVSSFTVNDAVYKLDKAYSDILIKAADIGRMYTYYIDAFGKVAFIDKSMLEGEENVSKYGYLVDIKKRDVAENLSVKLFDSTGVMKTLKIAKKVSFDPAGADSITIAAKTLYTTLTDEQGKAIPQLLQYGTNGKGEIREIKIAKRITDIDPEDKNKFTVMTSYTGENPSPEEKGLRFLDNITFGQKFFIGTDTVVMIVPDNASLNDEKSFAIGSNQLKGLEYYNLKAYNLNEVRVAGLILIQSKPNLAPGSMDPLYVVENITDAIDEDGAARKKIYLFSNGSKMSYNMAEACLDTPAKLEKFNKIEPGDVIQIVTNTQREISAFSQKYDVSKNIVDSQDSMTNYYSDSGGTIIVGTGKVKKADGNFVSMMLDEKPTVGTSKLVTGYFISYTRYYLVQRTGNGITVKSIRKTDLTEGMPIMFFRYYHSLREVIIYEGFKNGPGGEQQE